MTQSVQDTTHDIFRASSAQQRLWVMYQLEDPATFTVVVPVEIPAACDESRLRRALKQVVARHEALRTTFRMTGHGLVQVIRTELHVPLDVRSCGADWRAEADALVAVPFDLVVGPLVRASLLRRNDASSVLLLRFHHSIFDGMSESILLRDLAECFAADAEGRAPTLPPLTLQYADYAEWEHDHAADVRAAHLPFWREALHEAPTRHSLATDWLRPTGVDPRASERYLALDDALTAALGRTAREHGATPFVVLLAAFAAALARAIDQRDLVIGTPVAGRDRPELQDLVGVFTNTIVLRLGPSDTTTGRAWIRDVARVAADAFAHQAAPFDDVARLRSDGARRFTLQVLFAHRIAATGPWAALGWRALPFALADRFARADLSMTAAEDATGIRLVAAYRASLFEPGTIDALLKAWRQMLVAITARPDAPLGDSPVIDDADTHQLVVRWGDGGGAPREPRRLEAHVDAQVAARPDALAVVAPGSATTYRELQTRANDIALRLGDRSDADDIVGVWADRTVEYVAGLYGVLKAGAAYLPLDPSYPEARLREILDDARVSVIVGPSADESVRGFGRPIVDWARSAGRESSAQASRTPRSASDLAYVLYTSGSTGRPKGVAVEHRHIGPVLFDRTFLRLDPTSRMLHLSRDTFDFSTMEIWGPLVHGGCTVLSANLAPTAQELAEIIATHGVTHMAPSASYFNSLIDTRPEVLLPVRHILIGAEPLSVAHVRRARERLPHARLVNAYGPTETTVVSLAYEVPAQLGPTWRSVPIGRPLEHTRVAVLDACGHLAPVGVTGELYIGGAAVTRGYVHREAETAAAFVAPAGLAADTRWYRTGDYVRWRPDGTLEYVGRRDGQVKVRGQRIELGEIEAVLRTHPDVVDAAAAVKADDLGHQRLVGYVQTRTGHMDAHALTRHCAARLPSYMVPAGFMRVSTWPRSAHGKLDRRALPSPVSSAADPGVLPLDSATEHRLAGIFTRLLRVERMGAEAEFFALGGHSLLAVELVQAIEDTFGVRLPLRAVWTEPTIRALSAAIDALPRHHADPDSVVLLRDGGRAAPLLVPHGIGGVLLADAMVEDIAAEHRVLGLAAPRDAVHTTLVEMAQHHADVVDAMGHDPVALAGYSFAGLLAYEIAVTLEARGRRVPLLVVVDAGPGSPRSIENRLGDLGRAVANLPGWLGVNLGGPARSILVERMRRKATAASRRAAATVGLGGASAADLQFDEIYEGNAAAEQHRHTFERHLRALHTWTPRRYGGHLVVVRTRTRPLLHSFSPDLGWSPFVDGTVEVVPVDGAHGIVMRRPYVEQVAAIINERLARLR